MTYQTTGSTCSPAEGTSAFSRPRASLAVVIALLLAVHLPRTTAAVQTDQPSSEGIFCGVPLSQHLAIDATDSFNTSLLPGTVVSMDVITTPSLGVVKLESVNFTPATATCSGELLLTVPQSSPDVGALPNMVDVSACFDSVSLDYTITMSVVSDGPDNCAVSLPCGTAKTGNFVTSGEVDSYKFPGILGDSIGLSVTNISPTIGQVRVRLFDPSGTSIYDGLKANPTCPSSLRMQLPKNGEYTALISSCSGAKNGQYDVTWQSPSCTPQQPQGQFAYVNNADSGTMSVIDLSTNTTRLIMPIAPLGLQMPAALTSLAVTPNGAFTWATYGTASTTSVVNTSTNLLMASVPTGLDANGIAFSADGATAYVVANGLGGIALVDTRTNRVTQLVAQSIGFSQGIETLTTSNGTFLYVVSEDLGGLVKINTADYSTIVTTLDLGFYDAFAISPDGTFVYAGSNDGIVAIDTSTNMMTDLISSVGEPFAIAFTPDGRTAYATIADNGTVAVIDTATNRVVNTLSNVGFNPAGIVISPDTLLAYVTDSTATSTDPGVFVIDTKTNQITTSLPVLGDGPTVIALTTAPTGLCVGDAQGQSMVTIDELVKSVNYSLDGCPAPFPPTPTPGQVP